MGLIIIRKEELEELLISEASAWNAVCSTAPNYDAYEFDPTNVDVEQLRKDGYYDHFIEWIAGVQSKKIMKYLEEHVLNGVSAE